MLVNQEIITRTAYAACSAYMSAVEGDEPTKFDDVPGFVQDEIRGDVNDLLHGRDPAESGRGRARRPGDEGDVAEKIIRAVVAELKG